MPFKSKAQVRLFGHLVRIGKISKKKFEEWLEETGDISKLPERIGKAPKVRRRKRRKQ